MPTSSTSLRTITSTHIRQYATSDDRADHYDDAFELRRFVSLLHAHVFPDPQQREIRIKPYGQTGVDIGVFDTASHALVCAFDVERCMMWKADWPAHWRCLSFLARKEKYLRFPQFGMVWFNHAVTTCVVAWKEDILPHPVVSRRFSGRTYTDQVRELPCAAGTLIGQTFGVRETTLFANRRTFDFTQSDERPARKHISSMI